MVFGSAPVREASLGGAAGGWAFDFAGDCCCCGRAAAGDGCPRSSLLFFPRLKIDRKARFSDSILDVPCATLAPDSTFTVYAYA